MSYERLLDVLRSFLDWLKSIFQGPGDGGFGGYPL